MLVAHRKTFLIGLLFSMLPACGASPEVAPKIAAATTVANGAPTAAPSAGALSPTAQEWMDLVRSGAKDCTADRTACPSVSAKLRSKRQGAANPDDIDRAMLELANDSDRLVQILAETVLAAESGPELRKSATWAKALLDYGEHGIDEANVSGAMDVGKRLALVDLEATRFDEQIKAISERPNNFHVALMMSMIEGQFKAPRMAPLLEEWLSTARGNAKLVLMQTAARILEKEEVVGYCEALARRTETGGLVFQRAAIQGLLGARGCGAQRDAAVKRYATIIASLDARDADSHDWLTPVFPALLRACEQGTKESGLAEKAAEKIARETRWPADDASTDRSNAIETMVACDKKAAQGALTALSRDKDLRVREAGKAALRAP